METRSSKQSEGWAISLWHRYSTDIIFRTTTHIILLQIALTGVIMVGLWLVMDFLVHETSQAIFRKIDSVAQTDEAMISQLSVAQEELRRGQFYPIMVIVAAVVLSFGCIMLYISLTPTRLALERKKRFISNISHELRTPLTIMRTNIDLMLRCKEIPFKVKQRLRSNIEEFDRIKEIMDNVLSLSNLMQDQHLKFTEVNLVEVARRAVDTLDTFFKDKDISIAIHSRSNQTVIGNARALEQAVFNLLKNAIAHIDSRGTISIDIAPAADGKYINLKVMDTGEGIARHDLFHILEPFYRSQKSQHQHGSRGLGLAIVNEIIQMHRGKITIKSALKRGTAVTLSIKSSKQIVAVPETNDPDGMEEISMDFSRRILQ